MYRTMISESPCTIKRKTKGSIRGKITAVEDASITGNGVSRPIVVCPGNGGTHFDTQRRWREGKISQRYRVAGDRLRRSHC